MNAKKLISTIEQDQDRKIRLFNLHRQNFNKFFVNVRIITYIDIINKKINKTLTKLLQKSSAPLLY